MSTRSLPACSRATAARRETPRRLGCRTSRRSGAHPATLMRSQPPQLVCSMRASPSADPPRQTTQLPKHHRWALGRPPTDHVPSASPALMGRRQARCHAPNRARDAAPSGLRLQGTDLAMKSPRARRADRPPPSTTATRMVPRARHATRGLDVRVEAAPDLVGAAAVAMSRRSCDAPPPPPLPSAAARCMPAALGTCRSATGAQARRAFRAGAVRRARV